MLFDSVLIGVIIAIGEIVFVLQLAEASDGETLLTVVPFVPFVLFIEIIHTKELGRFVFHVFLDTLFA